MSPTCRLGFSFLEWSGESGRSLCITAMRLGMLERSCWVAICWFVDLVELVSSGLKCWPPWECSVVTSCDIFFYSLIKISMWFHLPPYCVTRHSFSICGKLWSEHLFPSSRSLSWCGMQSSNVLNMSLLSVYIVFTSFSLCMNKLMAPSWVACRHNLAHIERQPWVQKSWRMTNNPAQRKERVQWCGLPT
jgi:hypothetical protein